MKLTRIQEELERAGIEPNYLNVAIYVEFVVAEGLVERLELNAENKEYPLFAQIDDK
jgi:hypothetical protein